MNRLQDVTGWWALALAMPFDFLKTYVKMPQPRCPCRAHLRLHAQIVPQARSMLLEFPATPSLPYKRVLSASARLAGTLLRKSYSYYNTLLLQIIND